MLDGIGDGLTDRGANSFLRSTVETTTIVEHVDDDVDVGADPNAVDLTMNACAQRIGAGRFVGEQEGPKIAVGLTRSCRQLRIGCS